MWTPRRTLIAAAALLAATVIGAGAASAQTAFPCGITATTPTLPTITYNPFVTGSANGITNVPFTLHIDRSIFSGNGDKTQTVNFVFVPGSVNNTAAYTGIQIKDAANNDVFYATGVTPPNLSINNQQPGTVYYNFGGNTDTADITGFKITIPPGLDLRAVTSLPFDIKFVCKGTGGAGSVSTPATYPSGLLISINVLNGLTASYAGPTSTTGTGLPFGQIETITDAQAPTVFVSGAINVKSSGPYSVAVTSGNASNSAPFKMMWDTTKSDAANTIPYQVDFLNLSAHSSQAYAGKTCLANGVTANTSLGIKTTLLQGGQNKTPATYQDTLSVTFTPLAANTVSALPCTS